MKKMLMSLVLVPLTALADMEIVDGIEWTFTVSDGEATVGLGDYYAPSSIPPNTLGAIEIPESLGGCPATSIGNYAFRNCTGLKSVTIPTSVTTIGSSAFSGCIGLQSVTIPTSVTTIGSSAFSGCIGLQSVTIPEGVTNIGTCAFLNCSGLTRVDITNLARWCGILFAPCLFRL